MMSDSISVILEVGAGHYQRALALSLLRVGMLRRVFRVAGSLEIQEPESDGSLKTIKSFPGYGAFTRMDWAIRRRFPLKGRAWPTVALNMWLADQLLANFITPSTIFHGWSGMCLSGLGVAKRQGAITVLETGTRHPRHWQQASIDERRRFGVNTAEGGAVFSERTIRRMDREFQICDKLTVLSSTARRSFEEFGYGERAVMVLPGVDHTLFTPRSGPGRPRVFRICYVGRVELSKGLGYLLEAWKRLALPRAELLLIGEVRPDTSAMLKECANTGVKSAGVLSQQKVAEHYRESTVFVFPSVNEGLAIVLLEAMASGLPVIASGNSGADECVTDGKEGFIVLPRNVDALAEAILWCYQHPDACEEMGRAARARIENQFTLEHYNQRVISLYRTLASK